MHSWRMIVAAYVMVVVLLALLLGRFCEPVMQRVCRLEDSRGSGIATAGDPCPWQLDVVGLKRPGADPVGYVSFLLKEARGI